MILNLDPNFKPVAGEEIEFKSFTFSGGEPHIKIIAPQPPMGELKSDSKAPPSGAGRPTLRGVITTRLNSFNDLGLLCVAVDALKRMDFELSELVIPYFPAARQDRVMVKGEPLSVKVYADIINTLGFKKVIVFDAHSEVTPAVLNNCEVVSNHTFIQQVIEQIGTNVKLISPDGGALKKIYKVSEFLGASTPGGKEVVECSKSRDVKTGKLTGFKVYADDLGGQDCLIVDDICDGGGTFIGLAEELKNKNAGKLYLAVSHGIFSKGFEELENYFTHIFTTNSFKDLNHRSLTQINLKDLL